MTDGFKIERETTFRTDDRPTRPMILEVFLFYFSNSISLAFSQFVRNSLEIAGNLKPKFGKWENMSLVLNTDQRGLMPSISGKIMRRCNKSVVAAWAVIHGIMHWIGLTGWLAD